MKEIVKKSFLLGLGAASITKAKAEKIARELAKKGAVNTKDRRQLVRRVLEEANKERKRVQSLVKKEADRIIKKAGFVSRGETKKLKTRISNLEKRLRAEGKKTAKRFLKKVSR